MFLASLTAKHIMFAFFWKDNIRIKAVTTMDKMTHYCLSVHFFVRLIKKERKNDCGLYFPARALRALGLLLADGTPTGGRGEDFLSRRPDFFTETAVTPERKVEKSFPMWKLTVMPRAKNGSSTKIGVVWQKSDFWAKNQNFWPKKRHSLFNSNHVLATTGKSCSKKKSAFAQIIKGGNVILGDFLG